MRRVVTESRGQATASPGGREGGEGTHGEREETAGTGKGRRRGGSGSGCSAGRVPPPHLRPIPAGLAPGTGRAYAPAARADPRKPDPAETRRLPLCPSKSGDAGPESLRNFSLALTFFSKIKSVPQLSASQIFF